MGKEGLRLVLRFFNEEGIPKKDAREAADHCLTNYRFHQQTLEIPIGP